MIYAQKLTISSDTQLPSTSIQDLPVADGIVKQVFITFPGGLAGLVGVRVRFRERVLWPSNADQWFVGSGETFDFVENLKIDDRPHAFILEGYNNDCVYDHAVYFHIAVIRESADLLSTVLASRPTIGVFESGLIG